jgi:hypothetical protein
MTTFTEPAVIVEPKRDQWGRYKIVPAEGGKAVGHTRATTFIKAVADQTSLTLWAQRMTALGLVARPDIAQAIAEIPAPAAGDGKRTLDALCEEAKAAGGGNDGRDWGTEMHGVIEAINLGADPTAVDALHRPDVDAYVETMRSHGVQVYPSMVERVIVNAPYTVAGMFDVLAAVPGFDLPLVTDLKTGSTYGAAEWAIQLALYADATSLYNYADDTHEPMVPVDRDHGLIIHLPMQAATCTLYLIDLNVGREMVATCHQVREWRKRARKVLAPLSAPVPASTPSPVLAPTPIIERPAGPNETAGVDDRARHLHARLTHLQGLQPIALADVLKRWPTGTCTLSDHLAGTGVLVPWQLDQIEKATSAAEADHGVPFFPVVDPTAGGVDFDDPRIQSLIAAVKALPADLAADLHTKARTAGVPKFTERPTVVQLDVVADLLADAEEAWTTRCTGAVTSLCWIEDQAGFGGCQTADELLALVGCTFTTADDRWPISATQAGLLSDLGDAIGTVLTFTDGRLTIADGALDVLADRFGGKRPLLTAARNAAEALGLPKPGKSIDVVDSISLSAHLAVVDVETTP